MHDLTKKLLQACLGLALIAGLGACSAEAGKDDAPATDARHASATEATFATVGESAPDFTLTSAAGNEHSLADFKGKYVVLEWVNFDCPFVKKHYLSGNMPMLQKSYGEKDVVWLTICSSAPGKQGHFEGEALQAKMETNGWAADAYLIDANGAVGKMYAAKTTPHMYIIDPAGQLVYAGAIDDKPSAKQEDVAVAVNYVSSALDAVMAGNKVENSYTTAYGCSVKY